MLQPQAIVSAASGATVPVLIPSTGTTNPTVPIRTNAILPYSNSTGFPYLTDWALATSFQLSDAANYLSFSTLYDAYKINRITVTVQYLSNVSTVNGVSAMPTFYMYWDQDDFAIPGGLVSILGKQGVKKWQPTSNKLTKNFSFVPVVQQAIAGSIVTGTPLTPVGAAVPTKAMWINCTQPDIPHMAFKLYCQDWTDTATGANPANAVRVSYKYNVSFRSPLKTS